MGFNLKSAEDRIQSLEQLLSEFGSQLSKNSFDLSSNQQTLVVFNKILKSKPMLKHKRDNSPESDDMNSLERLATIKAVRYWKGIYQMYPHLETSTSSGKMMEGFYKSYFTEFDPYQMWLTPGQFFNTVVVKKQKNLLGLATITLVLRIAIISANNPSMQVKNLYKYFEQLTQLHLPESYGTPSFDNVLAYLFMGINCMSYSDHVGFAKYYTLAAKMTMLLDLQNAKDNYNLLPKNDPNMDRYSKEIFIWKSVYYMDSFFSVIHGTPPQFTKNTVWNEEVNIENMLKFLKITPFSTIPTNPPRHINAFYALTPGLDEIDVLAFHIVNRVKSLQEKYKHLAHPKLIPVQDIFFEYGDYTKLNRSSKIIQNTLVNLYTTDKMKEYLETPEEQSSASAFLKEMAHSLDLMIIYHYPHIKLYIQPAIMPASYIPKVSKIIDQLLVIYTDYFDLSPSHNKFQAYPPFRFDSIWNCLFTCLNISLQVPSNRINSLINKLILLITTHYVHYECSYSIVDLDKYLERYGHSLDQYSSNENTP